MALTLSSSPDILSVEPVRIAELSASLGICAAGIQKGQYLPPRRLSRRSGGAVHFFLFRALTAARTRAMMLTEESLFISPIG